MKRYHREISFKTLFLCFIRRFDMFFIALFVAVAGSIITSQFIIKKTYYSTATFERYNSVVKEAQYTKTKEYVLSERVINDTAKSLEKQEIFHANNQKITVSEISKGISVEVLETNSIYITIKYETEDKTIVEPVLYNLTHLAIDQIRSSGDDSVRGTKIASEASEAVKNNRNDKILITGIASAFVLALALSFVSELILDEVYDVDDINLLSGKAREVQFVGEKEKKLKFVLFFEGNKFIKQNTKTILNFKEDGLVEQNFKDLQNWINVNYKANKICVTSIGNDYLGALFAIVLSDIYKKNGKNSSLFELNIFNPQIESILAQDKSSSEKTNFTKFENYTYPSEVLDSSEFDKAFKKVKDEKTIFVGPDIFEHDDICLLDEKVDCYLVVVQKNVTAKSCIFKAIQTFQEKGINKLAFVIIK